MMIRAGLAAIALLMLSAGAQAAPDPKTCSDAYAECIASQRQCDSGCVATCKMRFNGCLQTGAFSTPGHIRQNLKRN